MDRLLEAEGWSVNERPAEEAGTRAVWHVMFKDTVDLGHLAVGEEIVRVVGGRLVATGAEYDAQSREEVVRPMAPFF